MRSRRLRTPWRAWRPLAALAALALLAGFAAPAVAAQDPTGAPIRILEASGEAELKVVPPGVKVPELRSITPYSLEGMTLPTETEPNNDFTTANPLGGSQAVILGTIDPPAEPDYFSFTALAGDRVYAATMTSFSNTGSTDTELTLYDTDGTTVLQFDDDRGSFSTLSSVIAGAILPANGTYYLGVVGGSATTPIRPYHLHVRVQSGTPGLEVEPNNDTTTATPLVNGWATGNISAVADPDLFSFSLNAGDSIYVALDMDPERAAANTNWNGRVGAGVFNNFFLVANDGSTTKPHAEAFFITAQESGTYYAYIDSTSATGLGPDARYTLSVSVIPKQVQTDCTIIPSTAVPVTIGPDAGTVTSTIDVPFTVTTAATDINVILNITHAGMLDLDVSLIAPTATSSVLFTDVGTATQPDMDIGLDDNAALPIGTFTVVKDLVYMPEQPGRLGNFNGENPTGTWTLSITDDLTNTAGGTLNSWSLEVCGPVPPAYGLSLRKTVGLVPGVCGTETEITAAPGTTVYYCYTATNAGLNAFLTHDLVDSELGTIFTGLASVLAPGASVSTVDLGLTISAVVTGTVTNSATWTGHDGGNNASGVASATVNVPTHCAPGDTEVGFAFSDFAGTFPPAGWTVTNTSLNCVPPGVPEWTNTNPAGRANLTGGTGPFAIADSDRCGVGSTLDTILTSPVLDLTGLLDPVVQFYMDYNDIATGGDIASVDVSTDGGATWTPVQTWDADFRGPLSISLPIAGAGDNDVQVRWHYINGTFDWWWEIDDAMVTACEPAPIPSITLDKTVGLVAGACGVDETLTVPIGTPVTYCYTVTNTGNVALNQHTLVDDQLGLLLDNFPFVLAPGAAAFLTVDDVLLDVTTVNNATWTASNPLTETSCSAGGIVITGAMGAPYPSTVALAGAPAAPTTVTVSLNGIAHTWPDDIDVLLVGPGGQNLIVMSDTGGGTDAAGVDLGLDDSAPLALPDFDPLATGLYRPADFAQEVDLWPPPAPAPPYGTPEPTGTDTFTSLFGGLNPNGTWNLYVTDGFPGADDGSLSGWCLSAVTAGAEASASDSATVTVLIPDIDVAPTSLSSFQEIDTQVVLPLDIINNGDANLDWTITEDAGFARERVVADVPGRQEPIRAHGRDAVPAPGIDLGRGEHSFSRAREALAGETVTPDRGEVPDATVTITHSATQNIVAGNSVACNNGVAHTPNSYIRRFTLTDFGITGGFGVTQVEIAIEQATGSGGSQPVTVNLYTWNPVDPFTFANFVPIGTANATVPDQSLTLITVPVTGSAPAGSTLVVEFFTPDGRPTGTILFVGSNPDGQTSPTFLAAVDCGVPEPTDTALLGFPGMHLVMNVTGTTGCDADLPWVSASPTAGTTAPLDTDTVDVTFDSTGLVLGGIYTGSLCIQSNDPDTPEILVPLTLEVDSMPFIGDFETGDTSQWTFQVP